MHQTPEDMLESQIHKEALKLLIKQMEKDGWRCIDMDNKRPDGIAVKSDGRIVALEAVGVWHPTKKGKSRGWKPWGGTYTQKRQYYGMFDDVYFAAFNTKTGEIRLKMNRVGKGKPLNTHTR